MLTIVRYKNTQLAQNENNSETQINLQSAIKARYEDACDHGKIDQKYELCALTFYSQWLNRPKPRRRIHP